MLYHFYRYVQKHLNESTIQVRGNCGVYNKLKPWITKGLINSVKIRDKLKSKLLKNPSDELRNEFKKYRNGLT